METIIDLEKWLIIKLDHYDNNEQFEITTDDVRKWINIYNDLIKRGYSITQNLENENR
jgi:hypothetical protein